VITIYYYSLDLDVDTRLVKIEDNSFMSEKCESDFHIFSGDSAQESPLLSGFESREKLFYLLRIKNVFKLAVKYVSHSLNAKT